MKRKHSLEWAIKDVIDFHDATDTPILDKPAFPAENRIVLRVRLLKEEVLETFDAIEARDLVEVADGIADIIYVAIGMAVEFGIPLADVWDEVQRSNMAKINPKTGKADKRADGKVIKPEGWTPPDIASIIGEYTP